MFRLASLSFYGILIATWGSTAAVHGQIEPIGPITIVGMQPVDYFFLNDIPPNPDRKVLDFLGEAVNNTGTTVHLDVMYDWVDAAGVMQFSPVSTIAIPSGGPHPVDPGPFTLNFCPQEVSLHFSLDVGEIDLQGQYGHICFPVPEPGLSLFSCLIMAFPLVRRRWMNRKQNT